MNKTLTTELAKRIGRDKKGTEMLLEALARTIKQHCGDMDSVAIPAFGTFKPVKHLEQVVTDRVSGTRLLLPPEVELTFVPAGRLRKIAERNG